MNPKSTFRFFSLTAIALLLASLLPIQAFADYTGPQKQFYTKLMASFKQGDSRGTRNDIRKAVKSLKSGDQIGLGQLMLAADAALSDANASDQAKNQVDKWFKDAALAAGFTNDQIAGAAAAAGATQGGNAPSPIDYTNLAPAVVGQGGYAGASGNLSYPNP